VTSVNISKGVRAPDEVLRGADKVEDALRTLHPETSAWPVVDENCLLGMVTLAQLQEAVRQGRGRARIADLLPPLDLEAAPMADEYPHLHVDQPLDTAVRRMAQSGLTVLPVVSRRNVRELVGVITLADAMAAYKSEDEAEAVDLSQNETRTPVALVGGILAVLILMIALAGFLGYFYHAQRIVRARQFALAGNELIAENRYQEAIERYRNALSISHSSQDRLALAMALEKAGHWSEAEIYLRELVRENPNSSPANLGLARVAVQQGELQDAVNHYHRAIYGSWPEKSQANRIQTRIELVETLGKAGQETQTQAELLSLVAEMPDDVALRKQVGRLLLDYGLPKEAAQVFREVLRKDPRDASAYAGLGQAEFAQEDFHSAQKAFEGAVLRNPGDAASRKMLESAEQIQALDPSARGLSAAEKYGRSRKLVEAALGALDQCLASARGSPPASLVDGARKLLLHRGRPRSYGDASETNLALADQLWKARIDLCGPPQASDVVLSKLMTRLSR